MPWRGLLKYTVKSLKDTNENQSKLFRSIFNFDKEHDSYFQKVNFKKELFKQKGIFLLGKAAQTVKYVLQGSVIAHFNYNLFQFTSTEKRLKLCEIFSSMQI